MNKIKTTKKNFSIGEVASRNRTARASRAGMCAWGRRTTGMFALVAADALAGWAAVLV